MALPVVVWAADTAGTTPLGAALTVLAPPLRADPPQGAAVIVPGLAPWAGRWLRLRARRPDLRILAVLDPPAAWEWPEVEDRGIVTTLERATVALAAATNLLVVPDEAAAAMVRRRLGAAAPPVAIEPVPSGLGGTEAAAGAQPGDDPVMVAAGPIEMRSNALLLLQLWRDGMARRLAMPRLVLAGPRGRQVEEIAPLLDWNPRLRGRVTEAPGLDGPALRRLLIGARALLAPDFTHPPAPLMRDARLLGLPVLAADTPHARALGLAPLLDPTDGPGWRAAILAAAAAGSRPLVTAPLLDWPGYAERLVALAAALP